MAGIVDKQSILFFDMDGTLVDTNFANFLSYKKAIRKVLGCDINIKFDINKRLNRSTLKEILPGIGNSTYDDIIREKENCYHEFLPMTNILSDTFQILDKYFSKNKIFLVSKCRQSRIHLTLDYHKILGYFDDIFFRERFPFDGNFNKFEFVISFLGICKDYVFVFENEENEIRDAISAGINKAYINPRIL